MKQHAPLLAATADLNHLDKLKYPLWVSPKLDGIRCIVVKGKPMSRKLKLIPNKFIQRKFAEWAKVYDIEGMDGELIVGSNCGEGVFQRTTSGVMSHDGEPSFTYCVFDRQRPGRYCRRRDSFIERPSAIKILWQFPVNSAKELLAKEEEFLAEGYEGLIARDPNAEYKHGRSTLKEGILIKVVRYATDEAKIIGFKEQMHNANEATKDNLGHTKRSSAKAGKHRTGILGAFTVAAENYRDTFDVGTGYTAAQRVEFWLRRKNLQGRIIRFKHKPIGAVDVPRHPVFQGFRSAIDL